VARFALLLLLPLGFWTTGAQAQDTTGVLPRVHVLPLDSAGYFNRMRFREFLRGLPTITRPLTLSLPGEGGFGVVDTARISARFDAAVAAITADSESDVRRVRALRRLYSFALDTSRDQSNRGLFGLSKNTADIVFDGTLEFHISSTRQHNEACTPALVETPGSGCTGGFTAPSIDNLVQLHSAGVFDQRFHINIDFDSKRDYAAGNIISGYYQGLEDEKLQLVEIGTQIFRPPPSRFLTATIPSNNFGIGATAVFGPVKVQGIAATQQGSVVATKTFTIGNGTVQPQDKLTRDLDYESDRVFWVVDPRTLSGYPSLDILNAANITVPGSQQPADVRIYRYVSANQSSGASANYDGITALGFNGIERTGALRWRLLTANVDYWLDPSGLWFVLANGKIDPSDYLAVSYRTKAGTLTGSFPTTDSPAAKDSIQLIFLPNRGPASPVFPYEMRQVYRIAGTSLVRSSLQAAILVSNSERPANAPGTFLSLLGLAIPADQASLDIDNRVFPRVRDPGASQVVKDALLIFPSVQPFSNPQLTAAERNDSLYVTPEYLLFSQGPPSKFQIHLQFDAQAGSDRSSIRLDAVQITEGSEHIAVNGRTLAKNVDYTIDYLTGQVTFLDPIDLFGSGSATVTASYEERGLFAQAPTSIAGLTATWTLGRNKTVSFSGLYQAEATGYTRPPIGYEPRASLLAGVTGDFQWDTPGITRFVNGLVTKRSTAPSTFALSGELAVSHPDPNRSGDAYLEEFENDNGIPLLAGENAWRPGSVPQSSIGLESVVGQRFDSADAVQLIWQNLVPNAQLAVTLLAPQDIDPTIASTSSATANIEPVMWMSLHADTAGGIVDFNNRSHWSQPARPNHARWRSMTTPLSTTGTDLSRNDYFEFALYETSDKPIETSQMRIVIDLGKVSEDALALAPESFRVLGPGETLGALRSGDTVYSGRQYVGVGTLNTEKTFFGTWNATTDDLGILGDRPDSMLGPAGIVHGPALCIGALSATVQFFPWGDLGSRCTNHNGVPDTEDLDGDNILDAQGPADDVFRYVVDLRDSASYFVRRHVITDSKTHLPIVDRLGRTASWTIYRVPLHAATDTIGNPDIHLIKQIRMTFATPPADSEPVVQWALALMKLTGAAWIARADHPIKSLSGPTAQFHGSVVIGTVSTQDSSTAGLGYTSPPGIGNASGTVTVSQSQAPQQINEKSLRIQVTDLHPGERAEGYSRLVAGTQNLLSYRQLRVWMRGHGPGWDNGQLQAYVKLGSDAYNFYLYKAPAHTTTWDPEMVIDLTTWQDLRQKIENDRLHGVAPNGSLQCGGDSTAYVACTPDGAYVVQVRDPQINPPNLAAVQELAAGMYFNATSGSIDYTELWVDDIRVSQPVSTAGYAGALNARLIVSDVATVTVAGVYQDGQFHLMGQAPTFQDASTLVTSTTLRLEKFLPTRLGLLVPASVATSWGWVSPQLISGTDVEASGLVGLRRPRNDATTWQISVSDPLRQHEARITRWLLNPLSFSASGSTGTNVTSLSQATSSTWTTSLAYFLNNQRRAYGMHLGRLTRGLPRWLRESAAGRGLTHASFAPVPTQAQFSSTLSHTMGDLQSFQVPIQVLADTILKPVTSEQFLWRNSAGLSWDPFTMLRVTSSWSSTRDLREYADSTTLGRVVNANHQSLLGTDVGVERDRNVNNTLSIAPRISSWLMPSMSVGTNFVLSRSLTTRNPVRIDGDTAGAYILPQTLDNSRVISYRVTLDPHILAQRLFGDTSSASRATVRFRPIEFTRSHTLESTFDLARFNPDLGYQLALGSFDSFLARNGQEAIGAADATATSVAASVDLPSGFTAQLNYMSTTSDRYQHRSGPTGFLTTTGTTEAWPSGRFSWSRTFAHGPVTTLTAGSVVEHDRASSFSPFDDGTSSTSTSETQRVTPNLTVVFRNGLFATLNGEIDNSNATSSGNLTQTQASNLTGTLSWTLRMPRFLSATRRSLQTNISVTQSSNSSCIQRISDSSCVPYYALSRLDVETGFTALLQRSIRTGVQFGYVHNAVQSLGLLTSTITISVFFSIPLSGLGM
jgi:hypothetical protein